MPLRHATTFYAAAVAMPLISPLMFSRHHGAIRHAAFFRYAMPACARCRHAVAAAAATLSPWHIRHGFDSIRCLLLLDAMLLPLRRYVVCCRDVYATPDDAYDDVTLFQISAPCHMV